MKNINVEQLQNILNSENKVILIDVRSPFEHKNSYIPNSINIPLPILIEEHEELLTNYLDFKIILYCNIGVKSAQAAALLESATSTYNLFNLQGGIVKWLEYCSLTNS